MTEPDNELGFDPDRYQVVFEHSILAAPVILAALTGELRTRFQFSSLTASPVDLQQTGQILRQMFWFSGNPFARGSRELKELVPVSSVDIRKLLSRNSINLGVGQGKYFTNYRLFRPILEIVSQSTMASSGELPTYTTFEIILPEAKTKDAFFFEALDKLLDEVALCVEEIWGHSLDRNTIWQIATYLNYTSALSPEAMDYEDVVALTNDLYQTQYVCNLHLEEYRGMKP